MRLRQDSVAAIGDPVIGLLAAVTLIACSVGATNEPTASPPATNTIESAGPSTPTRYPDASSPAATVYLTESPSSQPVTPAKSPSQSLPQADLAGTLFIGTNAGHVDYCAVGLIDSAGKFWEVFWPDGYSIARDGDSAALVSADGVVVAIDGSTIGVDGKASGGSFCMMGEPFEATNIKFVDPPVDPTRTLEPQPATPTPSPTPSHPTADLIGHLAGDSTPGCGLLVPDGQDAPKPWKIHWPSGYYMSFGPGSGVALMGPDGTDIAHVWDLVGVNGAAVRSNSVVIVPAAAFGCDWPAYNATEVVFAIPEE